MRFWKSVWWIAVLSFGSILWLGSAPAQSAEVISQESCIVKRVCVKPHKPAIIKPLVLDRFLYMCLYSEPLIIVLGADSIPLSLNVPDDGPPSPDNAAPEVVPVVTEGDSGLPGGFGDLWFPGIGSRDSGATWIPPRSDSNPSLVQAPEIDPSQLPASLTLLIGGLICLRRTK